MRVIAGSARRIQLKTAEGLDTRPTTDRIKETLFNMLQYHLADAVFLDLFSGSGAIGIEALSRGAARAVFVEQNPQAIVCIRDNLKATGLEASAVVLNQDVLAALKHLEGKEYCFDFVFMDPPYNQNLEKQVLDYLKTSNLIREDTVIIIEASLETDAASLLVSPYTEIKTKKYKTNQHIFIKRENV